MDWSQILRNLPCESPSAPTKWKGYWYGHEGLGCSSITSGNVGVYGLGGEEGASGKLSLHSIGDSFLIYNDNEGSHD